MDVPRIITDLLDATKWPQAKLADRLGVNQPDISRWLKGSVPKHANIVALQQLAAEYGVLDAAEAQHLIPVMGYVGAGGDVDPDYEQVPEDGLEQIEMPHAVTVLGDLVAFIVRGESMQPRYNDSDVVVVSRAPLLADFETLIGQEAVVVTTDGKRFLKRIMRSQRRGLFRLVSINADPMFKAIRAASPVRVIIPFAGGSLRRVPRGDKGRGE